MRRLVLTLIIFLSCLKNIHAQSEVPLGNNALAFNGSPLLTSGSYVQLPAGAFETPVTTVEMWVRTLGVDYNRCIYSAKLADGLTTRFSLHVSTDNLAGIWNGSDWKYVSAPVNANTWMHVAFAITATTTDVYTDGVWRGRISIGMSTNVINTVPRIGVTGDPLTSRETWRGGIDDIRIWSEIRSPQQIVSDMNDHSTSNAPNLLAYYDCNQGVAGGYNKTISTLIDRSPAARNGTLVNFRRVPYTFSNFVGYYDQPLVQPFTGSALFVNGANATSGSGISWATAFTSLADALEVVNLASQPVTVYVARGVYKPGVDRTETFAITRDGISLMGGYAGNETDLTVRDPRYNETILSGEIGNLNLVDDNTLHVLSIVANNSYISNDTKIDGFTIRDGYASGQDLEVNLKMLDGHSGAAIVIDGRGYDTDCSPVISNCNLLNNFARGYENGGGEDDPPSSYGIGGAVRIDARDGGSASPRFQADVFSGTDVDFVQGAVIGILASFGSHSSVLVGNSVFTGNAGANEMIYYDASFGSSNLNFINNTSFENGEPEFIHALTRQLQGGIYLANNIILRGGGGLVDEEEQYSSDPYQHFLFENNILEISVPGEGNIESNRFDFFRGPKNPVGNDGLWRTADDGFMLKGCGDALNNGIATKYLNTDITGLPRINQDIIDRGAYEGRPTVVVLSSTAVNNQPFVAEGCEGAPFTPYAIPGQPGDLSIAINWGANTLARLVSEVTVNTESANTVATATGKSTAAMRRYWNVNLNGQAINDPVTLRFYYDAADTVAMKSAIEASGPVSEIRWVKTNGTPYSPALITPQSISDPNLTWLTPSARGVENGIPYVEFSGITSFSGGGAVVITDAALPVKITSFKAKAKDCTVQLDWSVSDAVNFKGYEVERSANGAAYTKVVTVAHASGKNNYSFTDASPAGSGKYLYRLKLVDIDGKFVYSDVVAVESNCNGALNNIVIAPNPVRSELTIQFNTDAKNAVVNIRSMAGILISSTKVADSTTFIKIPVASLHAGIYLVELNTSGGKTITQKIVKQ